MAASPATLKGINYFPNGLFHTMWEGNNWPTPGTIPTQYVTDLATLATYGFNSVRVTLPATAYNAPDSTGQFNFPQPTTNQLTRLTTFCTACGTASVKFQVCMFDLFGAYGYISQSEEWISYILANLTDSDCAVIELINEIPLTTTSNYTGGFDGGFTGSTTTGSVTTTGSSLVNGGSTFQSTTAPPVGTQVGPSATNLPYTVQSVTGSSSPYTITLTSAWESGTISSGGTIYYGPSVGGVCAVWAQTLIPYIRTLTSLPVTISVTDSATGVLSLLPAALAAFTGSAAPDWIEWHAYPSAAAMFYTVISSAQALCNAVNMQLRIGETGWNTYLPSAADQLPTNTSQAQINQWEDDYIKTARWACQALKITCPEPAPWAMYDNQGGINFGLWDESGNPRAAARSYLRNPPGSQVRPPGLNLSFVGPVADSNGQLVPQSWWLYKGNAGGQPITATTSAGAVTLTSTNYESSGTDNPPAMKAMICGAPIVAGTGTTLKYSLSGTAAGVQAYIDYWDDTGDTYLGQATSTPVTLTNTPQTVTVSGTAPANTAFATTQIAFSNSSTTGGTIVINPLETDRTFTGPSGRMRLPLP